MLLLLLEVGFFFVFFVFLFLVRWLLMRLLIYFFFFWGGCCFAFIKKTRWPLGTFRWDWGALQGRFDRVCNFILFYFFATYLSRCQSPKAVPLNICRFTLFYRNSVPISIFCCCFLLLFFHTLVLPDVRPGTYFVKYYDALGTASVSLQFVYIVQMCNHIKCQERMRAMCSPP